MKREREVGAHIPQQQQGREEEEEKKRNEKGNKFVQVEYTRFTQTTDKTLWDVHSTRFSLSSTSSSLMDDFRHLFFK